MDSNQTDMQYKNERYSKVSAMAAIHTDASELLSLLSSSPKLKIFTPAAEDFGNVSEVFQLDYPTKPLAICRPSNEKEVADIVRFASSTSIPIVVRAGGHDCWGRSSIPDGIIIDLRELDDIVLDESEKSVHIGGGTIIDKLVSFLEPHGLVVPQGGCPSVGYTGWATCGGYGSLCGSFGLGADQILGARLVTPDGDIVEANQDILWGLRGGGCNFGVVTSLTLKVHSLPRMLAGIIVFPLAEAQKVLSGHQALLEQDFPDPLGGESAFFALPQVGVVLSIFFTWSSTDLATGQRYLEKIRELGNAVMDTVSETTLAQYVESGKPFSVYGVHINIKSFFIQTLPPPLIDTLLKHAQKMSTDSNCIIVLHQVHGQGAAANADSCMGSRTTCLFMEIVGASKLESSKNETYSWADEMALDFERSGMLQKGGHVALMSPGKAVDDCFGVNWEPLKALKQKFDVRNTFGRAVPPLV